MPDDYALDPVECWPENWPAFQLFRQLETQWLCCSGPLGSRVTGLNYAALYPLLDRQHANPDDWQSAFDDIRHMERDAIAAINDR